MSRLHAFSKGISSLVIFHNLQTDPVILRLQELLLQCHFNATDSAIRAYADFAFELFRHTDNFSDFLFQFVLKDANIYMTKKASKEEVNPVLEDCLRHELLLLEELSTLTATEVKGNIADIGFLPDWNNSPYDFTASYADRMQNIHRVGYGLFAEHYFFAVSGGTITPIKHPDTQTLEQFACYERERNLIVQNTLHLLAGGRASDVLLYGDSGTGKSATVKAIVNRYKDDGLRLIEIKKRQMTRLPGLLETLATNPLKFILFIDDLSFAQNDDQFSALKAILEGGASAKSKNVAIYATSNRRHLVKERFSDRDGDELRLRDTLEETASLAARFGLTVTFEKPDRDDYLNITRHLAQWHGLGALDPETLSQAEAFAIRSGGRSPRAARQFIERTVQGRTNPR